MSKNSLSLIICPHVMKLFRLTYRTYSTDLRHTKKYLKMLLYSPLLIYQFINIDKSRIEPNQCTPHNHSFFVVCAIFIFISDRCYLKKIVYQCRKAFFSIFHYFLHVVVVGSTINYVCKIGTLWFCYKYVENILT